MCIEHRPWGYFEVLADREQFKLKQIVVNPGQRLSLQRHRKRRELWLVIAGSGQVTLDEQIMPVQAGQEIIIPQGSWHRIASNRDEPLTFVEIQTGSYFGEDDIERREDDYGRIKE